MNILKHSPLSRFYTEITSPLLASISNRTCSKRAMHPSASHTPPQKPLFSYLVTKLAYMSKKTFDTVLLPPYLIKESCKIIREHFGINQQYRVNDALLAAVALCALSGLWTNPFYDRTSERISKIINEYSIIKSDEVFYEELFSGVIGIAQGAGIYLLQENVFDFLNHTLSARIAASKQRNFIADYLKNNAHYGVNLCKTSPKTEEDNYKNDLNPVQLYKDFESYNKVLLLVIQRFQTLVNLYTAYVSLSNVSPHFLSLSIMVTTVTVPYLFAVCVGYALVLNVVASLLEYPLAKLNKNVQHLFDKLTLKINKVGSTAFEQIALLGGGDIETKKILELHHQKANTIFYYDGILHGKTFIQSFFGSFSEFIPLIVCIKDLRAGMVKREQLMRVVHNFKAVSKYLSWAKEAFGNLNTIEESAYRIKLFAERIADWQKTFTAIDARFEDAEDIYFKGTIYNEEGLKRTVLAQGELTLEAGHIYHFDAPSGAGKTTLFKLFCRIWPHFDGWGSLPKKQTFFLPSTPYILDEDEPLIQAIAYPNLHSTLSQANIGLVKQWMKELNLNEQIILELQTVGTTSYQGKILNWMLRLSDGERKRVAFLNLILKLKEGTVKFAVLDEPFKGVDRQTQEKMVALLRRYKSTNCTILFSNHEGVHELLTKVIRLKKDKTFSIQSH